MHQPTIDNSYTRHELETLDVSIGRRCCSACFELVDAANGNAHVEAHTGVTSVAELTDRGGECCGNRFDRGHLICPGKPPAQQSKVNRTGAAEIHHLRRQPMECGAVDARVPAAE